MKRDFAWAIDPISPETFLSEYFEKKHMVVHRAQGDYYRDLLSLEDIDEVMTHRVLQAGELQLVKTGKGIEAKEFITEGDLIDPVRATRHFSEGATIVLPRLHHRLPRLAAFCRALETVFSCELQTNIYFTPDNAQGFKTHYDSHDVLVLQCHGTKTWRIYESPLELPLRSQAFDPATFERGEIIDEFTLQPGDFAYVPRGVVHDAIATDEISLHITTGLLATRWVEVLVEAISRVAHEDPAFRGALPPGFAEGSFDMSALKGTFDDLMARATAAADGPGVLGAFASRYRDLRLPVVPGHLNAHLAAEGLTPDSIVGARPDLIGRVVRAEDPEAEGAEVTVELSGAEIAFPAFVTPVLQKALTVPRFRIGDLPDDLDDAGKVVLVRRLLREGALRLISLNG